MSGVIGAFRENHDPCATAEQPVYSPQGSAAFERPGTVQRHSTEPADEPPGRGRVEKFLLGDKIKLPGTGERHQRNIGPSLVFGKQDETVFSRKVIQPLDPKREKRRQNQSGSDFYSENK